MYFDELTQFEDFDEESVQHIRSAEAKWRQYLTGAIRNPGIYQQFLLPLDQIESTSGAFDPNINRYLMRAIHMDILKGDKSVFTYSKIGRFIIFGVIHEPNMTQWQGVKVHGGQGYVEPRKYVLPRALSDYFNAKARMTREALHSVSPAQKVKIDQAFRSNIDRFVGSDAFIALQADVTMHGVSSVFEEKN